MDRRAFIGSSVLGALAAWRVARAQPARKVYRIGILAHGLSSDFSGPRPRNPAVNALLVGLGELGYVYGEHFVTEPRGSGGKAVRFPALAAEGSARGIEWRLILAGGRRGRSCPGVEAPVAANPERKRDSSGL